MKETMSRVLPNLLFACCCLLALPLAAQERITLAYPGPFNLSFLPLDLASKIGADAAEGLQLVPLHASGGVALQKLQNRNVDFAVAGMPAALSAKSRGNDVVALAAINDLPLFVLTVHKDLKGQVKRPRDLAGKVVGVISSSLTVKTVSHQLAELLLKNDGVPPGQIHIVAAGQGWEEQSARLRSGSADAILGFEPFASRLVDAGLAFPLFNLGDPGDAARVPGAGFLQGTLQTRSDVLRDQPHKAEKMVAVIRRVLQWMASHTPEEVVAALAITDGEVRAATLKALQRNPRIYSKDGKFSAQQLRETATFYAATEGSERPVSIDSLIDARWAGRKP